MGRIDKIHCEIEGNYDIVNCGRARWTVTTMKSWIFDKLKDKYKCKQCAKKENSDG